MRLKISSTSPVCKFLDDSEEFISIIDDDQHSSDEELYEEISAMEGNQLKKLLINKKKKIQDIFRIIEKQKKQDMISNGKSIKLKNKSMKIIPNTKETREILYIFGPSGSGKTVFTKYYADEYKKLHPKNDIYLFSTVNDDPSLEGLNPIRIPLDKEVLASIDLDTLANSLCIFDDTDNVTDPKLVKLIAGLKDSIVQTGRHTNISIIITTHMGCNYGKTRIILNETHKFVIFPHSGSPKGIKYLLDTYGGLDKKQIASVFANPSRWVVLSNTAPKYLVFEDGMELL